MNSFNPRARGGRDKGGAGCSGQGGVSIHAPAGGATLSSSEPQISLNVSIHAPAGGATLYVFARLIVIVVSIHAPAGGATRHGA